MRYLVALLAARALTVCPAAVREVCPTARCGLDVSVVVSGNKTLRAIGFDLAFDRQRLKFVGWSTGAAIRPWAFTGAQVLADSSRVRVGAFDLTGTVLAGTDTLAVLRFEASCGEPTRYGTLNLVDDLREAAPCEGVAIVECANALERLAWAQIKDLFR